MDANLTPLQQTIYWIVVFFELLPTPFFAYYWYRIVAHSPGKSLQGLLLGVVSLSHALLLASLLYDDLLVRLRTIEVNTVVMLAATLGLGLIRGPQRWSLFASSAFITLLWSYI